MTRGAILVIAAVGAGAQSLPLADILARVSEEAEVFQRMAPQTIAQETLQQRAQKAPARFRALAGANSTEAPQAMYVTREIISEYSFSTFKEAPGVIHEFRQIISVDGRNITTPEKARHALSLGLTSDDDRVRKRMLEDFEKYSRSGATIDFGQMILLFRKRQIRNYDFRITGEDRLGADEATVLSYAQREGPDNFRVFKGHQTIHERMKGDLWVRKSDGLPLRMRMVTESKENKTHTRRHEAVVEYVQTPFGMIAPASVRYSETIDDQAWVEDTFRYDPFKKFSADAEIKFDVAPEPEKK